MTNVIDNKITIKVQTTGTPISAATLTLLARACKVLSVSWTTTSAEPNTLQVQLFGPNGELTTVSRMTLVHKNISRGILRCPRGTDFGTYSPNDTVFTISSGTATTTNVFFIQVTVRTKYSEPVGSGGIYQLFADYAPQRLNAEEDQYEESEISEAPIPDEDRSDSGSSSQYEHNFWGTRLRKFVN